ncbi:uncharacterized protein [Physcomitrium patens]|uniref:DUF7356 domain-containing protein n=1 Tax=Physcomitrium patens TaxID=3218 RepID=A0A2K1L9N3_PHYPA|nr:uncharacterized protein LOC112288287 [Physcomitrium patens]PNR62737.1 hypothetical protein PHYPA_001161 [Physcomitrium patens]|eukprot:XP_024388488.1 uncharacterized protein LOC112288287 [Physcomitrella patens]
MVPISGPSCRTGLPLIFMLCTFTLVVLGEVVTGELIFLERIRGSPKLLGVSGGAQDEPLKVIDQQVVQSRGTSGGAIVQRLEEFFDHDEAKLMTENVRNRELKAVPTPTVSNNTNTNSTSATVAPVSPPPIQSKRNTSQPAFPVNGTVTPTLPTQNSSTGGENQSLHGGICDHGHVIGKLMAADRDDEDGIYNYPLTISNSENSKLNVTIKTPDGWEAKPKELVLEKEKAMLVTISMTDNEIIGRGAQINISWGKGDCYVVVPSQKIVDNVDHSSYMDYVTASEVFPLVLGGSVGFILLLCIAGVWGCVSWRARSRRHGDANTKYQELEIALPKSVAKGDVEAPLSTNGWDEVWEDDDWQDTEAVRASSTSLTVSAAGLNSRRENKDGWNSTWDD